VDDDTGWNDVLVGVWSPRVRDAAVAHVERATVGARCLLVHTLRDPEAARPAWVEQLHALVIEAIYAETGADLDELGSQAAWTAYEQVWDALAARWRESDRFDVVPLRREPHALSLLQRLSTPGAQAAGMDVGTTPPEPLWVGGRLHIDGEGLVAYRATDDVSGPEQIVVDELLALIGQAGLRP
jgi:hypothetical protein